MNNLEKTYKLDNGLTATVHDETSHYFGGYFHVRIMMRVMVPLRAVLFDVSAEFEDALQRIGKSVSFERTLEKMAVPEQDLDSVRVQLLQSCETNLLPYLNRSDFEARFVRSQYQKSLKKKSPCYQR